MEGCALLEWLLALAREAGVRVRVLPRGAAAGEVEPPPRSGSCRVGTEVWLLLAPAEPLEDQIAAAVEALRRLAPGVLEDRYLPPAVRARLEAEAHPEPGRGGIR